MGRDIKTDLGMIDISKEVIATLAGLAATECFGIVGMVSSRIFSDGISELLGRESLSKGVEVADKNDELSIKVNIVVGYGTKISVIANNVMENVKYIVEKYTGIPVNRVEVNIQGVRVLD
ncbi:MAG: Asp23/Gls24 family envelope stress response protein [Firmicutes bacterium]|nr:Asp23/Gls24 family envelope stress response protein [Bacillota bacterium]